MKLSLRPATPEDIPTLLQIEQRCFADPNWKAEDFLKYPCTVAELQGRIAGFMVVREICPGNGVEPAEREILNVAVDSFSRRLGTATALLETELQSGATYSLEVRESNVAAQTLYRKLGFQEIGRRKNYYRQPAETAIVMQKK